MSDYKYIDPKRRFELKQYELEKELITYKVCSNKKFGWMLVLLIFLVSLSTGLMSDSSKQKESEKQYEEKDSKGETQKITVVKSDDSSSLNILLMIGAFIGFIVVAMKVYKWNKENQYNAFISGLLYHQRNGNKCNYLLCDKPDDPYSCFTHKKE